jgi:hypothetical protein
MDLKHTTCHESSHTHRAISILMFYLNTAYVSLAAAMPSHPGATSVWSPPKYIFNRRSKRKSLLATARNAVALLCELRQTSLCPSVILCELCVELFGFHHRGH